MKSDGGGIFRVASERSLRRARLRSDRAQRQNSFCLFELGLRPERERRGAASHTARGLRALLTPRKGAALDRGTGALARAALDLGTGAQARAALDRNTGAWARLDNRKLWR